MTCDEEQSCSKIRTFIGEISQSTLNNIGLGSCNTDEFFMDEYGEVSIECFAKQACESSDTLFSFIGEFDEVTVTADNGDRDDTNQDRMKDATFFVDIGNGNDFTIDCGTRNEGTNCDSTTIDCNSGDCECEGQCGKANRNGFSAQANHALNVDDVKSVVDNYLYYIFIAFAAGMIMCCIGTALYWILYSKSNNNINQLQ